MSDQLYGAKGDAPSKSELSGELPLSLPSEKDQRDYSTHRAQKLAVERATADKQFGSLQLVGQEGSRRDNKESPYLPEEWNGRLDEVGRMYFKKKYGVDIVELSQNGGRTHEIVVRRSSDERQLLHKKYSNHQEFVDNFETHVTQHPLVQQYIVRQQMRKGGSILMPARLADPSSQSPRNQTQPSESQKSSSQGMDPKSK